MPAPIAAAIAGVTSLAGGLIQSGASSKATRAQVQAQDKAIAEQRKQLEAFRGLLTPYINAGEPALRGLLDLTGLSGGPDYNAYIQANPDVLAAYNSRNVDKTQFPTAADYGEYHYNAFGKNEGRDISAFTSNGSDNQATAVNALEQSPIFQTLARQGEDAILQNASATGGVRGGNVQGALARFRPQLLDQFIERQYGRLAGIAGAGQGAATTLGTAGVNTGANIGNNLVGQGQAQAQGAVAQGNIFANTLGGLGGAIAAGFQPRTLQQQVVSTIGRNPGIF